MCFVWFSILHLQKFGDDCQCCAVYSNQTHECISHKNLKITNFLSMVKILSIA